MDSRITIRIGDKGFAATLVDNPTAAAVKKLLPLSLTMTELNGNEKFAGLSMRPPTQESRPAPIHTGDLMLYGSSTLVLFYESFTTYSCTPIGRVDDPGGLKAALGAENVDVTFNRTATCSGRNGVARSWWLEREARTRFGKLDARDARSCRRSSPQWCVRSFASRPQLQELSWKSSAGEKHWHGAAPTTAMTHIAIQESSMASRWTGWNMSPQSSTKDGPPQAIL